MDKKKKQIVNSTLGQSQQKNALRLEEFNIVVIKIDLD